MNDLSTSGNPWFARGAVAGALVFAALNALSWFWRSAAWSDLCGATRDAGIDAIGFPFEIWREGSGYGSGWLFNFPMMGVNLLFAAIMALGFGWLVNRMSSRFSALIEGGDETSHLRRPLRLTFSVRGLFVATTVAALFLGTTRMLGVSPWLLGAIYFVGPLVLILIAMAPTGLHWEQRMVILIGFAVMMLVGSVMIGSKLGMEFDRVLFGIFICWVPQSVFASALILLWEAKKADRPGPLTAKRSQTLSGD